MSGNCERNRQRFKKLSDSELVLLRIRIQMDLKINDKISRSSLFYQVFGSPVFHRYVFSLNRVIARKFFYLKIIDDILDGKFEKFEKNIPKSQKLSRIFLNGTIVSISKRHV